MDETTFSDFLTEYEKDELKDIGVELQPIGLIACTDWAPSQADLRRVGLIIASLKKRIGDKDDCVNWAIGDWLNWVEKEYGMEQGIEWLKELAFLNGYRDHLLQLTGATL